MSNILAITDRELKAYFASPIAWVAVGLFALLVGGFYFAILDYFIRASMQMEQMAAMGQSQPLNINLALIGPLLQNVSVIVLFLLPMITMRTYSEEKRSGTIELLLTSPLTDFQIIMGKFLGAVVLYAIMLLVTVVHMAILFVYGQPEWKSIVSGYLGLLLMGAAFISVGLFISSTTKNQIVAGMLTFAVLLMLWIVNWFSDSAPPAVASVLRYLSITAHFDDFAKGIIDTTHLAYYLSFIALGLFLTIKSVDTERWRG